MEISLKYNKKKYKLDISKINNWNDLNLTIRKKIKIDLNKDIDIYVLPENNYLKEANFEEEFLNVKNKIKGLSIVEEIDLDEKLKSIIDETLVPINRVNQPQNSFRPAESIVFDKNKLFNEKCQFCGEQLGFSKFSCLLCNNYFLCSKCEENHPHPLVKYKSTSLSDNIEKIISLHEIKDQQTRQLYTPLIKSKLRIQEIKKLNIRTNISSNSFKMGPNQNRSFSLVIKNPNNFVINKGTLNIIIRDQYDLDIYINEEDLKKNIEKKSEIPIQVRIRSNKNGLKKYSLSFEVVNNNLDIISEQLEMKIEIINDEEDNELNKKFERFPSIMLLPKEKKEKLKYIIDEKLSIKTPQEIKAIMEKFQWNIDEAIIDLTS